MSTLPPDFYTPIINGVHEVAGHNLGKSLVNVVRDLFSITGGKVRDGDYLYSRSRTLLRQYHPFIPSRELDAALTELDR